MKGFNVVGLDEGKLKISLLGPACLVLLAHFFVLLAHPPFVGLYFLLE